PGEHVEAHRDQRASRWVEQFVRLGGPDHAITEIRSSGAYRIDLHVLAKGVVELAVARAHLPLHLREVEQGLAADEGVHARDERLQVALDDEILALLHERLHGRGYPGASSLDHLAPAP